MADEIVYKRLKWARRQPGTDPVLFMGEIMIDHDAKEFRIGNGADKFSDLKDIVSLDPTKYNLPLP